MRWWLGGLVLLILGWVFRLGLLVYAMYVYLGILWLSRISSRRWLEDLDVKRDFTNRTLNIGDRATVEVRLLNQGRRRIPWLLVEESLPTEALIQVPPRLRVSGSRMGMTTLRAGKKLSIKYEVEFLMRGYYQIGPMLVETGDLFGLHRRFQLATEPAFVLVHPKVVALEGYDLASRRPMGEVRLTHRFFEDPTRIHGVRSYQRGDPMNRIHWRATARTGEWQSKSYDASCVAGATLLLDFHIASYRSHRSGPVGSNFPGHRPAGPPGARAPVVQSPAVHLVELAVTTVASIADVLSKAGEQVGLATNGRDAPDRIQTEGWHLQFRTRSLARASLDARATSDRLRPVAVETRRGADQFGRILDVLARLELTDGLPFPEFLKEMAGRIPRDATVVAVLTQVTEETAVQLGILRRSGFAVTAVLVSIEEPQYHDWSAPPDWAARLVAEGIDFRRVEDEASLAAVCRASLVP